MVYDAPRLVRGALALNQSMQLGALGMPCSLLRVVLGHPRLLPLVVDPHLVLVRLQCVEVRRHEVVKRPTQQRAKPAHRVKAGVPLVRARLDVRCRIDQDGVTDVVGAEVWPARDEIALVHDTLYAQVRRSVHELCERRVTHLGAAEVDDLHVLVGVLEREADSATARGRGRVGA